MIYLNRNRTYYIYRKFPGGTSGKEPAKQEAQETWAQFLDWENPLEKEMATHSSILAWRFPWTEEPARLLSMGSQRVRYY